MTTSHTQSTEPPTPITTTNTWARKQKHNSHRVLFLEQIYTNCVKNKQIRTEPNENTLCHAEGKKENFKNNFWEMCLKVRGPVTLSPLKQAGMPSSTRPTRVDVNAEHTLCFRINK